MNKAVFLDRDGTILKDCDYLSNPDHIRVYKGVIPALKNLKKKGWRLVIGTNQSGIGRGYFTVKEMEKVHRRLFSIFKKDGLVMDMVVFCPHGPNDGCDCRKPGQGMIRKAAKRFNLDLEQCVAVGDKESDILWGKRAGARTVLVLTGSGRKVRDARRVKPDYVARSLSYAVKWILKNGNDRAK